MKNVWEHHFKYYDFFQMHLDNYRNSINWHLKKLNKYNNILDSGAGSGNLTYQLLKNGHLVSAVDLSEVALYQLKRKCEPYKESLKVINGSVEKLKFKNNEFDAISSMFVIPFVKNTEKYFSEAYRVIKTGGLFSISAWASISLDPKVAWRLLEDEEEELIRKGVLPEHIKEWKYILESSKHHLPTVMNGLNLQKLEGLLKEVGFKNIKHHKKALYGKYAYFLTSRK